MRRLIAKLLKIFMKNVYEDKKIMLNTKNRRQRQKARLIRKKLDEVVRSVINEICLLGYEIESQSDRRVVFEIVREIRCLVREVKALVSGAKIDDDSKDVIFSVIDSAAEVAISKSFNRPVRSIASYKKIYV